MNAIFSKAKCLQQQEHIQNLLLKSQGKCWPLHKVRSLNRSQRTKGNVISKFKQKFKQRNPDVSIGTKKIITRNRDNTPSLGGSRR